MNEEQIQDPNSQSSRATAVSVFEQSNGMNDFPVLKAFQEYIDAEQARARKRMLGLSIFFVVLLVVVVVTFSVIMAAIINRDQQSLSAIATRNQELSDKLLDIALRERQPSANVVQPTVPVVLPATSPADSSSTLKPVLDRLERLATSLNKPQQPPQVQMVAAPAIPPAVAYAPAPQPTADTSLAAAQGRQDEIRRQREAIAAERAKLKAEQERLRREEVEQHRRRLYPEYYAQEDARGNTEASVKGLPPPPPISAVRKDEKAEAGVQQSVAPRTKAGSDSIPTAGKSRSEGPKIDRKTIVEAKPVDLDSAKPISYFDQDDDSDRPSSSASPSPSRAPVAPQAPKGENTNAVPGKTETISVGAQGSDQIPWLIELPETK